MSKYAHYCKNMKIATLRTKLKRLIEEQTEILSNYNSEEELKAIHALYEKKRKLKRRPDIHENFKKANTHYLQLKRLSRKIERLRMNFVSDSESIEEEIEEAQLNNNTNTAIVNEETNNNENVDEESKEEETNETEIDCATLV